VLAKGIYLGKDPEGTTKRLIRSSYAYITVVPIANTGMFGRVLLKMVLRSAKKGDHVDLPSPVGKKTVLSELEVR